MLLARVTGEVVATIKHGFYQGRRMLLLDTLDASARATGNYLVAIDAVDAGPGQTVLVLDEGNSARQVVSEADAPVRSVIVGVVDEVSTATATGSESA
jgi:ethanolamine utilization protein EutN